MSTETLTNFETFLRGHDEEAWARVVAELLPHVHEVDRNAVQIWFRFFPLALHDLFERAADPARLAQELEIQGNFRLEGQVDSSHTFLYGHRFWPEVKREVVRLAEATGAPANLVLSSQVRDLAALVAAERKVEQSLVVGIAAVALMTLRQVGLEALRRAPGEVLIGAKHARRTPEQILKARARDDAQGLLGFLRTTNKTWTVVWDENADGRSFKAVHSQEVASGAATDKRPWHELDARCTVEEGPIPVQCRSASCGTCWVGVLGGAEKLSPVAARERRKMPEFGYIETDEAQPLIRLSCQAQTQGALSIVIPPWNGYFGKYLKKQREAVDAGPETRERQA
jgi:ferredoxin